MTDPVTLLLGDCLEVMPTLEAESVDAVVTDPPYGLEFMGKEWDSYKNNAFQSWCEQWGREALRVTKPGGYLLAFGGTRTHHRLVCALEDAGWIIRDELDWIYASGFPKGKANLKPAHEPIVLARKPGPLRPLGIDECRIPTTERMSFSKAGPFTDAHGNQGRTWNPTSTPGIEREQHSQGRWPSNVLLSPAVCAIHPEDGLDKSPDSWPRTTTAGGAGEGPAGCICNVAELFDEQGQEGFGSPDQEGRWPGFEGGGYSRFFLVPKAGREERERGLADRPKQNDNVAGSFGLDGARPHTPADYQYERKARANVHPTVKPIDLMRHLVRLVTPVDGVVLDPFLGSGTTALAASEEGFSCIGIEREAEYLEIARGRLAATKIGMGL